MNQRQAWLRVSGQVRLVPGHQPRHPVLDEQRTQVVDHERRGVDEAVKQVQDAGADVRAGAVPLGRRLPGQVGQVLALVLSEAQGARQRGEHRRRRVRPAPLLEPGVVVGRDGRKCSDLVAAQARGAAPPAGR